MEYEPTIGVETHAQLLTRSKMFCWCSADYATAPPNSHVCPVCLGMPGALPVINQRAIEFAVMTGLALNCQVAAFSKFDRKNYGYPDLPKGYQISQYDLPLCPGGWMDIESEGQVKRIRIARVHQEEDTGKLMHSQGRSLVDYNRSGVPLIEIVTEPDFVSIAEVREYIVQLHRVLRYLGVSSGNMEEGAMRFEANISLHPTGSKTLGNRVEIKNLNSFRSVLRSLEYEISRQRQLLADGAPVLRETRGWDEATNTTYLMRTKELSDDYRYFPEPDLPPLAVPTETISSLRASMPELPAARMARFQSQYRLTSYDAALLTDTRSVADYFDHCADLAAPFGLDPKIIANWILGELFRLMNQEGQQITDIKVSPRHLVELLQLLVRNQITQTAAKRALPLMFESGQTARAVVDREGLAQVADQAAVSVLVDHVIAANPDAVAQFRAGKETVLRFLVGQVMRASRGTADPNQVTELLRRRLLG